NTPKPKLQASSTSSLDASATAMMPADYNSPTAYDSSFSPITTVTLTASAPSLLLSGTAGTISYTSSANSLLFRTANLAPAYYLASVVADSPDYEAPSDPDTA